jgi:hypothetical protein
LEDVKRKREYAGFFTRLSNFADDRHAVKLGRAARNR